MESAQSPPHAVRTAALEAEFNRAASLHRHNQWAEAELVYREILKTDARHFPASAMLAGMLLEQGRFEAAAQQFAQAIRLRPNVPMAHFQLACALRALGRLDEALESCNRAISLKRDFAEAFSCRGHVYKELGRHKEALASFDRLIALKPADAEALNNRGLTLHQLGRFEDALASYDRAIALQPENHVGHFNRGKALYDLKRFEDAVASYGEAIARNAEHAEAFNNRGLAFQYLGRSDEALEDYDSAIERDPQHHNAFFNRAMIRLRSGQFAAGWEDWEHRWFIDDFQSNLSPGADRRHLALWTSIEGIRNRRVLLLAEQGVGDEIMLASMIPDLLRDAAAVALECDCRLAALYGRSFPQVRVIPRSMPVSWDTSEFDVLLPIGALGRLYRSSVREFPDREKYLTPHPAAVTYWREHLSNLGPGLKVGISWRGGTDKTRRQARSIPLELWRPLLSVAGARFVSLQYGNVGAELEEVNAGLSQPIASFEPAEIDDFDQLAGLVNALDLVISVQTALVHLGGATGQDCRVLVPYAAEWRYGAQGDSMPWYRSVRLYRQKIRGQWEETLERVASDLASAVRGTGAGRSGPQALQ